jgi:hypothetical protein
VQQPTFAGALSPLARCMIGVSRVFATPLLDSIFSTGALCGRPSPRFHKLSLPFSFRIVPIRRTLNIARERQRQPTQISSVAWESCAASCRDRRCQSNTNLGSLQASRKRSQRAGPSYNSTVLLKSPCRPSCSLPCRESFGARKYNIMQIKGIHG